MNTASDIHMKNVECETFGRLPSGEAVDLYTLTNSLGNSVKISNYGAIVTSINVPDREGNIGDVVLGFDDLEAYLAGHPYFGAICGRIAGRISNSEFTLNGTTYKLLANDGPNHLHGGEKGFDKVLWQAQYDVESQKLILKHTSPHMDQGYPGELQIQVAYGWSDENELSIDFTITTDQETIVNLTNHSYFNLSGRIDVLGHILQIDADEYAPTDENMTLLGRKESVEGTANDFREGVAIGEQIKGIFKEHGDTYFCRGGRQQSSRKVASVCEPVCGRTLEVLTTEPVIQFYSGMGLDGSLKGKEGKTYGKFGAFCLEAQEYADAINAPHLGNYTLSPDQTFRSTTIYRFGVS